jgi:hypothetical protein
MSNVFEAMMKQYENSHNGRTSTTAKKYDLKNYFSTYLPKGVNQETKQIRILPPDEGSTTPFTVLWGHKAQVEGEWKTFPCLKHEDGEPCPFCEARQALLSTGKDSDKELAKKYSPRMMYVVKIIDRNNESEGVKFWRFNHDYRKTGTMDKIMGAISAVKHDITDINEGRDLLINIARDQNNRPVVQSITYPIESTPLSSDENTKNEWVSDTRTWRDVYSTRKYEYLAIVVGGETPVWDKEKEKYVSKESRESVANQNEIDNLDSELRMGSSTTTNETTNTNVETVTTNTPAVETKVVETTTATSYDTEDDDLPF